MDFDKYYYGNNIFFKDQDETINGFFLLVKVVFYRRVFLLHDPGHPGVQEMRLGAVSGSNGLQMWHERGHSGRRVKATPMMTAV